MANRSIIIERLEWVLAHWGNFNGIKIQCYLLRHWGSGEQASSFESVNRVKLVTLDVLDMRLQTYARLEEDRFEVLKDAVKVFLKRCKKHFTATAYTVYI